MKGLEVDWDVEAAWGADEESVPLAEVLHIGLCRFQSYSSHYAIALTNEYYSTHKRTALHSDLSDTPYCNMTVYPPLNTFHHTSTSPPSSSLQSRTPVPHKHTYSEASQTLCPPSSSSAPLPSPSPTSPPSPKGTPALEIWPCPPLEHSRSP